MNNKTGGQNQIRKDDLSATHERFIAAHRAFLEGFNNSHSLHTKAEAVPTEFPITRFNISDAILLVLVVGFFGMIVWIALNPGRELDNLRYAKNQMEARLSLQLGQVSTELTKVKSLYDDQANVLVRTQQALRSTEIALLTAQGHLAENQRLLGSRVNMALSTGSSTMTSSEDEAFGTKLVSKQETEQVSESPAQKWRSLKSSALTLAKAIADNRKAYSSAFSDWQKVDGDARALRDSISKAGGVMLYSVDLQSKFREWTELNNKIEAFPPEMIIPVELTDMDDSEIQTNEDFIQKMHTGNVFLLRGQEHLILLQDRLSKLQTAIAEHQGYMRLFAAASSGR